MTVWKRDLLAGGGEIRAVARTVEWAATPLGPPEEWSDHTRTVVDLCLESAFPMMLSWGPDLVQIYNDRYRNLLGRRHPAALGQRGRECWSDVWDVLGPLYEQVTTTGEAAFFKDLLLVADRYGYVEESHAIMSLSPVRDPEGEISGVLTTALDTTDNVLELRRLHVLSDVSSRASGRSSAVDACRAAVRALSQHVEDIPYALIYLKDSPGSARLVACTGVVHGGPLAPERIAWGTDGEPVVDPWHLAETTPDGLVLPADQVLVYGELPPAPWNLPHREALVIPITARRVEEPLGYLVAGVSPATTLEERCRAFLRTLAESIGTAAAAAQRVDELKRRVDTLTAEVELRSRFIAGVSHELRTPLNAIVGHADLLREGYMGPLNARQAQQIGHVASAALHLLDLVEEILAFARMEVGATELHLRDTDVALEVRELAELLEPLIASRGLEFVVNLPEELRPIVTDQIKLRQILINLLSNAQKYTERGTIELTVAQEVDGAITVDVRDTGVGIDPRDQTRIFEPFWRMPGATETSGTGLGLTVSRSLARLLGGDLTVSSERGVGSRFTLRLPDLGERAEEGPGRGPTRD